LNKRKAQERKNETACCFFARLPCSGHLSAGLGHHDGNPIVSASTHCWLFSDGLQWPSFNGALASIAVTEGVHDADPLMVPQQYYCVCNTLLSLLGSCLSTFATSALLNSGKFDMMHIQNASLAGESSWL
jgi:hypothetical protein